MAEHYFTGEPTSRHEARTVCVQAGGRALAFESDAGTFSKTRLDPGSRLLLEALPPLSGRCADIGCGWGAIGVSLAAQNPDLFVEMVDVNERAVGLARRNAEANGVYNGEAAARRLAVRGGPQAAGRALGAEVPRRDLRPGPRPGEGRRLLDPGGAEGRVNPLGKQIPLVSAAGEWYTARQDVKLLANFAGAKGLWRDRTLENREEEKNEGRKWPRIGFPTL